MVDRARRFMGGYLTRSAVCQPGRSVPPALNIVTGTDFSLRCSGVMGRLTLPERNRLILLLPVVTLLSITWTAWLPTYAHFRRAELQGRKVRVRGRERYIVNLFPFVEIVTPLTICSLHYPTDITGRGVGWENVYSNPDCVVLAPSFDGLPFPALPSCFTRQPHVLQLRVVF